MFQHIPVLLDEAVHWLAPAKGKVFVDGTLGGGGHSEALLASGATVYGIDRDNDALAAATKRLAGFPEFHVIHGNFHDMKVLLADAGVFSVDGVLLDLGISSYQVDTPERGFSYHADAPLDMRMDQSQSFTAEMLLNTWPREKIARVLREYGEESWAVRIAEIIVEHRKVRPLETTGDLVRAVDAAIPKKVRSRDKGHPAQQTFQAVRIAVNDELAPLKGALEDAVSMLKTGGRLCVITFHSLEDRIVKQAYRQMESPCTCPPGMPVCVCENIPTVRLPARKGVKPSPEEVERNPRARSALLRVAEKR